MAASKLSAMAHNVLHYVMSKAMLEGKTGTTSVNIPLLELQKEYEEMNLSDGDRELVLRVTIKTEWDEGDELSVDSEEDTEYEE